MLLPLIDWLNPFLRRTFAEEAAPHDYEPMLDALKLMVKAFDITDWRDLLTDEDLNKEMKAYTHDNPPINCAPEAKLTLEHLPFFMRE